MRKFEKLLAPMVSLLFSILLGTIVIYLCGFNAMEAYAAMLKGAFGNLNYTLKSLEQSTPLILCGLAAAVAIKSGLFNIGAEGQLFLGALGYTLGGLYLSQLPGWMQFAACLLLCAAFGAAYAFIPAIMRIKLGANEVVSSIMLNYIAKLLIGYLVSGPLMAPGDIPQSDPIAPAVRIGELLKGSKLTWAFIIALVACVLIWLLFERTTLGYNITAAGENERAAEAGGVDTGRVRIGAMLLSGCLAALSGGMLIAGTYGRLVNVVSAGYGFEGISIAVLGQFSPWGIILSSILFGALHTGSLYMEMFVGIPTQIIEVLQGMIIVVIASPLLFQILFKRQPGRKK